MESFQYRDSVKAIDFELPYTVEQQIKDSRNLENRDIYRGDQPIVHDESFGDDLVSYVYKPNKNKTT